MLVVWTTADAQLLRRTIGASLEAMRPNIPEHSFAVWQDGPPVVASLGEVVLTCGTRPLDSLKKAGLAPKNRALTSLREKPLRYKTPAGLEAGHYLVTYDPAITHSEPDKQQVIDWDLRLAVRLLTTGSMSPEVGHYRWVGGFSELISAINCAHTKTGQPVDVTMDTETMGLHPWDPDKHIVSIGFTCAAGKADCLYLGPYDDPVLPLEPDLFEQITWLLTTAKVKLRGSNLKYDLVWIAVKWGIECTNFKFDNCVVGSLVDENRSNGLNLHAKVMTTMGGYDDAFNAKWDKAHMERVPPAELLPYQGADCDAAHRVADTLRDQLLADGHLARLYVRTLHPAVRAFERIERRGVVINLDKYQKLGDDLSAEIKRLEKDALALLPNRLRLKYRDKIKDQLAANKSPFTPALLKDYFFGPTGLNLKPQMTTPKSGEPSTARAHLRMFVGNDDARAMCTVLEAMNSATKTRSTFVDGFLKHLRPDGRLHPSYMLYHGAFNDDEDDESGTVSGRLAAKDPAIQTLPKRTAWAKRLRECYEAPSGKLCFDADYQQGELRGAACIAPEPKMIAAYKEGMDLHSITAASMAGMPLEDFLNLETADPLKFLQWRTSGKAGNFGLLYGMSAEGFQAYAWAQYQLVLTLAEAEDLRNTFLFEQWTGLPLYHDRIREFVRKHGYVRSPLGRVRHLPMIWSWDGQVRSRAERQAINAPIQSCLNDMMLDAIWRIEAELAPAPKPDGDDDGVEIAIMTHDSIAGYVPAKNAEDYIREVARIMSTLPLHELGWQPELDFPADAGVGPNLGQMQKLKLAA
jgi:DNA polymerase I-like protein with 3'-5' exonuclease and polymerase domains